MKKRVLSLVMAFVLSFSMMPMSAFAEEAGTVTEQKAQNGEDTAEVSNTGEDTAEVSTTGEDISGGNAVTKDAEVEAAQALINALPEEVTAENADVLQAQLMAIYEALAALTEAQTAKLDKTRLENIYAALNGAVAVQATTHVDHSFCGATDCQGHGSYGKHNAVNNWIPLSYDEETGQLKKDGNDWNSTSDGCYILPAGNYYLETDLKTDATITIQNKGEEVNLCLNGHSITATGNFDVITQTKGTFRLCDCQKDTGKITHQAEATGRGVCSNGGSFYMFGGTITGNKAENTGNKLGGGVYVVNYFHIFGGIISDNQATAGGGVYGKNSVYINGGFIRNNTATSGDGGGVYIGGEMTMNMYDVTITGNKASGNGGGVYLGDKCVIQMSNVTITGNNAGSNGGGMMLQTSRYIDMRNKVEITGNTVENNANNVYLKDSGKINITGTLTDSKIGVSLSIDENDYVVVAKGSSYLLTSKDKDVFDLDDVNADYVPIDVDNSVAFRKGDPHKHAICVNLGCTETGHDDVVWKGINDLDEITEDGNYYLKKSVTLSSTWTCGRNVNLCLNGNSITMSGANDAIKVVSDCTFTLCDCNGSNNGNGKITHISGKNGSGVVVNGSFTMYGGSITGNTTTTGGGVNVGAYRNFTMYGGSITNNIASGKGGGVNVGANGTMTVGGSAQITDNGDSNVYLPDGQFITVDKALNENAKIHVTTAAEIAEGAYAVIAEGTDDHALTDNDLKAFTSDSSYTKKLLDNGIIFINGDLHEHGICGKEDCSEAGHGNVAWTGVSTLDEIKSAGHYYLKNDIALANGSAWKPADGVVLCLNGHSITQTKDTTGGSCNVINVKSGNSFTLSDCKGKTGAYGKITHTAGGKGSAVSVESGSGFYFYGGCITGNDSEDSTVPVNGNFYMYDGEIKGNVSSESTTVFVDDSGTFNMSGGSITGNSVKQYGGVGVKGAITVSGDVKITGNVKGGTKGDDGLYTGGTTGNVYLFSDKSITVGGALSESASIGVTSGAVPTDSKPVTIATATTDNWIKDGNFTADSDFYKVTVSADGQTATLGLHEHQWEVRVKTGSENILEEYCGVAGCTTVGGTLTLEADDQKYSGEPYDFAKCVTTADWKHTSTMGEVYYTDSTDAKIDAPVKPGTYYANVTVDGVTATQEFSIDRWKLSTSDFEYKAPDNLIYDGNAKEATVTSKKTGFGQLLQYTVLYFDEDYNKVENPTDAGTYTVEVQVTQSDAYEAGQIMNSDWTFTIAPKPVTITGISAQNKEYDGKDDATITGAPVINGLVTGDANDVTVDTTNAKAAFADKDAGTAKTVTFNGYALTGTKAGNYSLSAQPASVTADITPRELRIVSVTAGDKTYDGTKTATVTGVTFDGLVSGESLTKGTDYTVTGSFADAAVGAGKAVTVKVELSDSVKNYTFADGAKSAESTATGREIKKATVQNPAAINYTIIKGAQKNYTITLPGLPTLADPQEYGACIYYNISTVNWENNYGGNVSVIGNAGNNVLTLQITSGSDIGNAGTITVVVTTDNYEDITLTVNITATDKIIPQLLAGTLKLTPAEITYGEKLESITISGTMMTDGLEEIPGTFAWENPDAVLDAGSQQATWKFTPDDTQTYAETSGITIVKVNKAAQSGAVLMDNYTYNETPATPDLTDRKGDPNAKVTYYYSTTRTNSGGTEWKNIGPTTLNAGTYYMYAVIGATGNYNAYTTEVKAFEVWKAAPVYTKPSGLTAKYGQKLSEITLPNPAGNMSGTWSWDEPDTVIDKTGTVSYDAYFTPDDTNYKKVVGATIAITVTPGDGRNLATEELKLAFNDNTDHTYTPDWSGLPAGQTWNYECESSISNGSKATLTRLNVAAADGGLTYAVSDGKAGDEIIVTLKACCNNYEDFTIILNIRITKAMPTGAPKYTLITAEGKTLADAGLTLTDSTLKPAAGKLEWMDEAGNVLTDDTEVKVNTDYWWRFTPTDTNYDSLTGKVELYHVDAPAISAQPKSVSVTAGEKATFEVTATGTDVTYQWQIDRNDGNGFVDINGATGAAYTTGVTDKDCDGFKYQCVIRNAAGSVTTDTVVLTVKEKYTITATAGEHGSISPNGAVEVVEGSKQTFVITAEEGYEIESLIVDGRSVDIVTNYSFENVTAAHTIAVTFKQQYKIIDGADSSWNQDTDGSGSIKIRGNGEFSKFVNVKVDGTIVDPANYTATEGSTIIELHADYLKTLSEGSHTFEIAWTDGTAKTSFTVARNTSGNDDTDDDNDDSNQDGNNDSGNNSGSNTAGSGDNTAQTLTGSPNTGDASGLWITLFVASVAGLAVMLVRRKNCIKK